MTDRDPSSHLHRLLLAGEFVVTAEMQTSDSADPAHVAELAETLRGKVDAVNCTDNSAAHAHIAPMAAARLLLDQGVEPLMQLVCRDRNRLALQADLLGAAALGVRNIVCMTGDDVSTGDHPETKPIYDIDSVHLIRMARIMRDEGTYLSGRQLTHAPDYLIGAVENPFAPPLEFRPDAPGHEDRGRRRVHPNADLLQPGEDAAVHGSVRRARAARPRVGAGGGVRAELGGRRALPTRSGPRRRRAGPGDRADGGRPRARIRRKRASRSRSRSSRPSARSRACPAST